MFSSNWLISAQNINRWSSSPKASQFLVSTLFTAVKNEKGGVMKRWRDINQLLENIFILLKLSITDLPIEIFNRNSKKIFTNIILKTFELNCSLPHFRSILIRWQFSVQIVNQFWHFYTASVFRTVFNIFNCQKRFHFAHFGSLKYLEEWCLPFKCTESEVWKVIISNLN